MKAHSMTAKKAIQILDWCMNQKKKSKEGLIKQSWGNESMILGLVGAELKSLDVDIYNLDVIRKQLIT